MPKRKGGAKKQQSGKKRRKGKSWKDIEYEGGEEEAATPAGVGAFEVAAGEGDDGKKKIEGSQQWEERADPNGNKYWYNASTGVSQWEHPNMV